MRSGSSNLNFHETLRLPTIAVAASGGVDSLCALLLLKRAGYPVFAIHGSLLPGQPKAPLNRLRAICQVLEIDLHVFHLEDHFDKSIISAFRTDLQVSLTPNPCAWCNRLIKFGALQKAAIALGADLFATGHYCRLVNSDQRKLLAKAADSAKDQGYFLSLLEPAQLKRALFPLGSLTKQKCRQIIQDSGFHIPVTEESQDICFKSSEQTQPALPGPVLLKTGAGYKRIGEHTGLWRYTIGQRRGLGIPAQAPLYVIEKDYASNSLLLGRREDLIIRGIQARLVSLHLPLSQWPGRVLARLRYRGKLFEVSAKINNGLLDLEFSQGQAASAPGQIAAIYDEEGKILAGSVILTQRRGQIRD